MTENLQQIKTQLEKLSDEEIINALNINIKTIFSASRRSQALATIIKEILIQQDKERFDKTHLSHSEWQTFMFSDRVEETFLNQKEKYETVSFWYWVVDSKEKAMEFYYQLCNDEISFIELKKQYRDIRYFENQPFSTLSKALAKPLLYVNINVPVKPVKIKNGHLIMQKVSFKKAKLDEKVKQDILDELESDWAARELSRLLESD